jgi:rifampicin phosphotransferase
VTDEPTFEPPGAGGWDLDRSHYPGGTTPIAQDLMGGCAVGMRKAFAELGIPAETLDIRFVDGFMYSRLRPLISPDRPAKKLPPAPILKLAVRLHPEMRRRAKTATRALGDRPWRGVVKDWDSSIRPRLEKRNDEFGSVDETTLDDAALADHLEALLQYCRESFQLHFYLHAFDLGPIGMLLADCKRWGISPDEVVPTLAGASPSTSAPSRLLTQLRKVVAASGQRPSSIDDLRNLSAEASGLLDEYMHRRGRMMVTRYDLDGRTLEEQPDLLLTTILEASDRTAEMERATTLATELRNRVPAGERDLFDERLTEARDTMDLRDDNGPNTVELPVGLLRHGLLEAGSRLAGRGRIQDRVHIIELAPDEIGPMVREGKGPSGEELARRAVKRQALAAVTPPARIGPEEVSPPLEVLMPAHRILVSAVQDVIEHMGMSSTAPPPDSPLHGVGIGSQSYRGRARVADSPEAALDSMEPGDVLIVRFTTPAYNTVLMLAGAVVTATGALLSHAAVMARELGIPAVIGAPGALDIPDGAEVEVDPVGGVVRVLAAV